MPSKHRKTLTKLSIYSSAGLILSILDKKYLSPRDLAITGLWGIMRPFVDMSLLPHIALRVLDPRHVDGEIVCFESALGISISPT